MALFLLPMLLTCWELCTVLWRCSPLDYFPQTAAGQDGETSAMSKGVVGKHQHPMGGQLCTATADSAAHVSGDEQLVRVRAGYGCGNNVRGSCPGWWQKWIKWEGLSSGWSHEKNTWLWGEKAIAEENQVPFSIPWHLYEMRLFNGWGKPTNQPTPKSYK